LSTCEIWKIIPIIGEAIIRDKQHVHNNVTERLGVKYGGSTSRLEPFWEVDQKEPYKIGCDPFREILSFKAG